MASTFFKRIPRISYNFQVNGQVETHDMVNLQIKYVLSSDVVKNAGQFYKFAWRDHMRPDSFATIYYGTDELYWLGLFSAGVYDVHNELPRSDQQLAEYMYLKYKDTDDFINWCTTNNVDIKNSESIYEYAAQKIVHYVDADGDVVDPADPNLTITPKPVYLVEYELDNNEDIRNVNIIDNIYAQKFKAAFDSAMTSLRADLKNV